MHLHIRIGSDTSCHLLQCNILSCDKICKQKMTIFSSEFNSTKEPHFDQHALFSWHNMFSIYQFITTVSHCVLHCVLHWKHWQHVINNIINPSILVFITQAYSNTVVNPLFCYSYRIENFFFVEFFLHVAYTQGSQFKVHLKCSMKIEKKKNIKKISLNRIKN